MQNSHSQSTTPGTPGKSSRDESGRASQLVGEGRGGEGDVQQHNNIHVHGTDVLRGRECVLAPGQILPWCLNHNQHTDYMYMYVPKLEEDIDCTHIPLYTLYCHTQCNILKYCILLLPCGGQTFW